MKPLFGIAAIPALAAGYYFGIALPAHNDARLVFERQKYVEGKIEEKLRQGMSRPLLKFGGGSVEILRDVLH